MAKVVLKNVSKVFGKNVRAVNNADFTVEDKEFLVLVGPSGCGKSTTLRMVAGLEEITEGEIYIDGALVNHIPPKDRNIAMVFQNYALYPHMDVYTNMGFGLKLRKYDEEEINRRVNEAAQILGIKELLKRKPGELSGGQKQRVAVGRAIVRKPKVFLFDEPLSNLDAKLRVQMRAELKRLHNRLQATIIYVTHDQVEAMTLADRIVILKDGDIQQIGTPLNVYAHPRNKFVAGFIGTPPMNFMNCKIIKKEEGLYLSEGTFEIKIPRDKTSDLMAYEDKEIIFGIRPENIYNKIYMPESSQEFTATATVEVTEPLGAEIYLFLNTGKHVFVVKTQPYDESEVNQDIEVVFDLNKMHLFDKDTEEAIIR